MVLGLATKTGKAKAEGSHRAQQKELLKFLDLFSSQISTDMPQEEGQIIPL